MAEDVAAREERTRPTAGRLAQALKRVETSGWKENRQETPVPKLSKEEPLSRETLVRGIAKLEGTTPQKVEEKVVDRRRGKDIERFKDIMATTKKMEEEKRQWEEGSYERFLKRQAKVPEEAKKPLPSEETRRIPYIKQGNIPEQPLPPAQTPEPPQKPSILFRIFPFLRRQ